MKLAIITAGKSAELIINHIKYEDCYSFLTGAEIEVYDDYVQGKLLGYEIKPGIFKAKANQYIIATSIMSLRRKLYEIYIGKCLNIVYDENAESIRQGEGNIIFPNTYFGKYSSIGSNNIISAGTIINHHCKVGDGNLFGTGVLLNGSVVIGNDCDIGSGVIIEPKCIIGNNVKIASGTVIIGSISNNKIIKAKAKMPIHTGEYITK